MNVATSTQRIRLRSSEQCYGCRMTLRPRSLVTAVFQKSECVFWCTVCRRIFNAFSEEIVEHDGSVSEGCIIQFGLLKGPEWLGKWVQENK